MEYLNIEIKAKCINHERIRDVLNSKKADFDGIYHQIDTYFKVNLGRLKLREMDTERYLVFYERENKKGPKQSKVILFKLNPNTPLKEILAKSLGILTVIDKQREIYFIDNVKFHIDTVKNLGTFIEIEATNKNGTISKDELLKQCQYYLDLFQISKEELIPVSYSDLLLKK